MDNKHTPGPWIVDKINPRIIYENDATGRTICIIQRIMAIPRSAEQDVCNANLISAAPELLEALKALLDISPFASGGDMSAQIHADAQAAIAKAEGR